MTQEATIIWEKLHPDVELPMKRSTDSAGYILKAYLLGTRVRFRCGETTYERGPDMSEQVPFVTVGGGDLAIIPLGFRTALPAGYQFQLRPPRQARFDTELEIADASATIDSDFRGEWSIVVRNAGLLKLKILHGQPIAQAVLARVVTLPSIEGRVDESLPSCVPSATWAAR